MKKKLFHFTHANVFHKIIDDSTELMELQNTKLTFHNHWNWEFKRSPNTPQESIESCVYYDASTKGTSINVLCCCFIIIIQLSLYLFHLT